jgi:hypothetical protein
MESGTIRGVKHFVYADQAEWRKYHPIETLVTAWRTAHKGDWVVSDDGGIVQILREYNLKRTSGNVRMLGTIVGTFPTYHLNRMDTDFTRHPNRYNVSCLTDKERKAKRRARPELTARDLLIVNHMLLGMSPEQAIRITQSRTEPLSPSWVKAKIMSLFADRRVLALIKDGIKQAASRLNIGAETIITRLDELSKNAEKETVREKATMDLAHLMDLEPDNDKRNPFGLLPSASAGEITDGEFHDTDSKVRQGQRASEGKALVNGYQKDG